MKSDKKRIEMRRSQIKRSEVKRSVAKRSVAKKSSSVMKEMGSQTTSESNYYATNYNDDTTE